MQMMTIEPMLMVTGVGCDRCGEEAKHAEAGIRDMISIALTAGDGLSIDSGSRVLVDLCQLCLSMALGPGLRVRASAKVRQENRLSRFRPKCMVASSRRLQKSGIRLKE